MNKIEDVKPGQTFVCMGVTYQMLRFAGECTQPKRNQWGRPIGGTYIALRYAVKVDKRHKGWWFSYVAFHPGQYVTIAV